MADDHKLFCEGLERLLTESGYFQVMHKFHDGRNLLECMVSEQPDLLVVDIEMPGLNGLDAVKRIRLSNTTTKIVTLSMHEEHIFSREAFEVGSDAYLIKSIDSSILIESLLKIVKGEKIFPVVSIVAPHSSPLSDREDVILRFIAKGKTSEEIAQELKISVLTVKAHRRNLGRKLNTKNPAELITRAMELGIL